MTSDDKSFAGGTNRVILTAKKGVESEKLFAAIQALVNRNMRSAAVTFGGEGVLHTPEQVTWIEEYGIAILPHAVIRDSEVSLRELAYLEPERVVEAPPFRTVQSDNDGDTYNHLKYIGALRTSCTGRGVRVAILDTGVYPHVDIVDRLMPEKFPTYEGTLDKNGHGTHGAGLIVGSRRQDGGYGVAPEAELYVGRVLDADGFGIDGNILLGLTWAACKTDARVIVLPLSAALLPDGTATEAYEKIAADMKAKKRLVIAAAGNKLPGQNEPVHHPANAKSIMAAGAVNRTLDPADFSCVKEPNGDDVEIVSPGVTIRSTWNDGGYRRATGTSAAAAIAAGLVALWAEEKASDNLWDTIVGLKRPLLTAP